MKFIAERPIELPCSKGYPNFWQAREGVRPSGGGFEFRDLDALGTAIGTPVGKNLGLTARAQLDWLICKQPISVMKKRALWILFATLYFPLTASALIFVKIDGFPGDDRIQTPGYNDGKWFVADSFSFGVHRSQSGEKGGTADINIGVGELQECTISKSMDSASARLAQFAINGNSPGTAEIDFVEVGGGDNKPVAYLKYKLDRCFIKSWSTSGDADDRPTEEVAFYYNKIAFQYAHTSDGVVFRDGGSASWDAVTNKPWADHNLPKPETR